MRLVSATCHAPRRFTRGGTDYRVEAADGGRFWLFRRSDRVDEQTGVCRAIRAFFQLCRGRTTAPLCWCNRLAWLK